MPSLKPGDCVIAVVKDIQPGAIRLDIGGTSYVLAQQPRKGRRLMPFPAEDAVIISAAKRFAELLGELTSNSSSG